jgi:hypothetical protein
LIIGDSMVDRMKTFATVKWVELRKHSPRVTIILRVPHVVSVPHGVDVATGRYLGSRDVTEQREQQAYVWRDTLPGALVASLCERAETTGQEVVLDYEPTPFGWRLTHADLTVPGPPAGALIVDA